MNVSQVNFTELTSYVRKRNLDPPALTGGVKLNVFFLREKQRTKKNETQNRTLLENRVKINQQ